MVYFRTFTSETKEKIMPIFSNDNSYAILPCENKMSCGLNEIFADCEELNEKKYLNVTKLKDNLNLNLTFKGQADFDVSFGVQYLFIPYTKNIYTTISLSFNNEELVKEIFSDGLFDNSKYKKYFIDFAINMINKDYKIKNEIEISKYIHLDVSLKSGDWSECRFLDVITDYKHEDFISSLYLPRVVAEQHIISDLIRKVKKGFECLKCDTKIDHNNLLLELKKEYIDYLNLISDTSYRDDGKKSENYMVLYELFNIESLNEEYQNLLKNYEDLVKTIVDKKNIALGDMLNTIQISSIVLTIVGWVLVILQHDLPSTVSIYIVAILICSLVSITVAITIKKVINSKE